MQPAFTKSRRGRSSRSPSTKAKQLGLAVETDGQATGNQESSLDSADPHDDHQAPMTDPISREEHDAKLALMRAEARTEAVRQDGKLDLIQAQLNGIASDIGEDRKSLQSLKTTIITTVLSTGIGVVLAMAALFVSINQSNQASQANMLSAFQAGLTALTAKPADK